MAFASDLKRNRVKYWWEYEDVFGTVLAALAIDEFGTECLSWEPETIRLQLKDILNADLPQVNMDKLMAMFNLMTTNLFYTSFESFSHIANALNDAEVNFQVYDPVDADEAAWAITEAVLNDPIEGDEDIENRFSPEVRRYIGVILEDEGMNDTPPAILSIATYSTRPKRVDETFADDPEIFAAFYKLGQAKVKDVEDYIKLRLKTLIHQLKHVPLQNRDSKSWQQFLDRVRTRLPSLSK